MHVRRFQADRGIRAQDLIFEVHSIPVGTDVRAFGSPSR